MSGTTTSALTIAQFPCLNDNYGYLVHDETTGETVAIDTPCALTYRAELQKRGWTLSGAIWNTHHHHDHTGGSLDLKQMAGVKIYGPASEKISGMDGLKGGDSFEFGSGNLFFRGPCQACQSGSTSVLNWQLQQRHMLCQA
mmetsp:Transcript_25084/g.35928  ORF Transcript_25084/g.35928 Transcript_25084/m.35928 type:complete len:141 (-) Transcript_25084:327-749(-)